MTTSTSAGMYNKNIVPAVFMMLIIIMFMLLFAKNALHSVDAADITSLTMMLMTGRLE